MKKLFEDFSSRLPFILAGSFGGFCAVIADILRNDKAAITMKMKTVIKDLFSLDLDGGWIVLVVILFAGVLCWIFDSNSKTEAFTRGLSIFTIFTLITPYKEENPTSPTPIPEGNKTGLVEGRANRFYFASWESIAVNDQAWDQSNATIRENEWISSCKPSYNGPLGLGSLVNNSINYCPMNEKLLPAERVRIVAMWDTSMRGHRYVEVQFQRRGKLLEGWVWAGKDDVWYAVIPDNEKRPISGKIN